MITAIDTNILIDILAGTASQIDAAEEAVRKAGRQGQLILPIICYAELAFRFKRRHDLDAFLDTVPATLLPLEPEAAFLAGNFFREYLLRGGGRSRIMADFIVAAQAQIHADRLLTTDKRFYGTSFPKLKAISPADLN